MGGPDSNRFVVVLGGCAGVIQGVHRQMYAVGNTHEPHARISSGKKGYAVALRTGPNMAECERMMATIEHFYGHLEIVLSGRLGLCSVSGNDDVQQREPEIAGFGRLIGEM